MRPETREARTKRKRDKHKDEKRENTRGKKRRKKFDFDNLHAGSAHRGQTVCGSNHTLPDQAIISNHCTSTRSTCFIPRCRGSPRSRQKKNQTLVWQGVMLFHNVFTPFSRRLCHSSVHLSPLVLPVNASSSHPRHSLGLPSSSMAVAAHPLCLSCQLCLETNGISLRSGSPPRERGNIVLGIISSSKAHDTDRLNCQVFVQISSLCPLP